MNCTKISELCVTVMLWPAGGATVAIFSDPHHSAFIELNNTSFALGYHLYNDNMLVLENNQRADVYNKITHNFLLN